MKKAKFIIVMILFAFVFLFSNTVSADIGPKPSLTITINYNTDNKIHVEILKRGAVLEEINDDYQELDKILYDYLLNRSFDNYVSASLYNTPPYGIKVSNESSHFLVTLDYRYPRDFKILILDETNNQVFITKAIRQEAFHGIMEINLSEDAKTYNTLTIVDNEVNITEKHSYKVGVLGIVVRVILTLVAELIVLFLFFYRKKASYLVVLVTNLITQVLFSIILFLSFYFGGSFVYLLNFIICEVFLIGAELFVYSIFLDEKSKNRAIAYTFVANALTIALTFIPFLMI